MALVWQAALGRAATQALSRRPVMVHIDEVQDYLRLPGDLSSALAQARGLGVGFTLEHQHLGQLPKDLNARVMANARSRLAFRLSRDDAKAIASLSHGLLTPQDYQSLARYHAYASLLVSGETQPPFSLATTALGQPLRSLDAARSRSRARFGQPLPDIETDLTALIQSGSGAPNASTYGAPHEADDGAPIGRTRRRSLEGTTP